MESNGKITYEDFVKVIKPEIIQTIQAALTPIEKSMTSSFDILHEQFQGVNDRIANIEVKSVDIENRLLEIEKFEISCQGTTSGAIEKQNVNFVSLEKRIVPLEKVIRVNEARIWNLSKNMLHFIFYGTALIILLYLKSKLSFLQDPIIEKALNTIANSGLHP